LPEDADAAKAGASMKDGVLSILIPRVAQENRDKTHNIAISKT